MGVFLTLLGRGIQKVFEFIGSVLLFCFNLVLKFLVFIRLHFKKLAIAALIGATVGSVYQYGFKDRVFESSMTVQPNFGSAVQLYKNIEYYQSLIEQEDLDRLASSLGISREEAQSLTEIEVEPYSNESQKVLSYKEFMASLDSTTVDLVDFNAYSKALPVESFKYHVVRVRSKDKTIFSRIEEPLINSVTENSYYVKVKATSLNNLLAQKKALERSVVELDSLRNLYNKVLLAESTRESSGTSIYMSELGKSTKEIEVFETSVELNRLLSEINGELTEKKDVINVVSSFSSIGMEVRGWFRNHAMLGLLAGFILTLMVLLLIELNKILKKHAELA